MENITIGKLKENFSTSILEINTNNGDAFVLVEKKQIIPILTFLKNDSELDYNMLIDLSAVDYLKHPVKKAERFEIVYQLYSLTKNHKIRIKVSIEMKDLCVDSATSLWKSANWAEREVFDMFGIKFNGHPNLRRILTHHEFIGHPLRKDYPIKKRQILSVNDTLMDEMEQKLREKGLKQ